ncbi:serine threonine kinase [Fusarium pseudoanthophilum]|uniref:Serine threonine kinase n=1 Tax=Fusarium pseudoanthophilum TaxID=48495 RepID=A0A8H5NYV4_9HYPO|nr:serine threonine kinase [Fusarium pseudoanthophilum]
MPGTRDQYTVGWISALDVETSAVEAFLGQEIASQEESLGHTSNLDDNANQDTKGLRGESLLSALRDMKKQRATDIAPYVSASALKQYWTGRRVDTMLASQDFSDTIKKFTRVFSILVALESVRQRGFKQIHDRRASLLPFYDFGDTPDPLFDDVRLLSFGGTAQVSQVKLQRFCLESVGGVVQNYAVKKLLLRDSDSFCREISAYEKLKLAQSPHPHIVPLLASYRTGGKYHLVFPLAQCDLARYWRTDHLPTLNSGTTEWFASQMAGLAHALSTIHRGSGGSQEPGSYIYGVHGDIKPANILCFGSDDREPSLAITDFGSSYFLTPKEKEIPRGLKHTPVYRAPEVDTTTGGITQAYDIWSLGCVFLEAIVWFLGGKAGIAKLTGARMDQEGNSPNRDAFFRVKFDKRGGLTAEVKPEVQRVLLSLSGNPRATPFFNDMLCLVMDGMLNIDMNQRMSAREIFDALTRMCMKLEEDPAYSHPRDIGDDVEMAFSWNTPYFAPRSTSLTTSRSQVHTNQNVSHQQLDQMVDVNDYSNLTTQSDTGTQLSQVGKTDGLRFACPYNKAGIRASIRHRACEGPGWPNTNRLKYCKGNCICLRCYTGFDTDALLQAHLQQEPPCSKTKLEAAYGILSGEQAAQIHTMKRKSSKETEEDRWFSFYRMVSPTFNQNLDNISPYHEANSTSLGTLNSSTISNKMDQYRDHLRNRGAEEHAARLAKMGIDVTLEVAAKLLESQIKDVETFDEAMRGPFNAYGFETENTNEQAGAEGGATELTGSSDLFSPIQLLARYEDDKEH